MYELEFPFYIFLSFLTSTINITPVSVNTNPSLLLDIKKEGERDGV